MSQQTTNYNFKLIESSDEILSSLTDLNSNFQSLDNILNSITGLAFQVVASLPVTGSDGIIYLLSNSGTAPNIYDEYIWVNNAYEKIGSTAIDLSGYEQTSNKVTSLSGSSTDTQYPSAKAVYKRVSGLSSGISALSNQIPTGTEEGENINIQDSSDLPIKDITIKGNTEQDGTPTPSNPVDIEVVTGDVTFNVLGKNILPTNKDYWESGHYNTSGQKSDYATRMRVKNLIPVLPSTEYYISNALNSVSYIIREYDESETLTYNIGVKQSGSTFTTTAQTYYISVSIDITYSLYDEQASKLFLCNNNVTDKSYEPYKSQSQLLSLGNIELCKIGDYQDYIYKDKTSGKWYLSKNTNKFVFDGSESWTQHNSTNENFLCVYRNISDMSTGISIITNLFTRKNKVGTEDCVYNSYQQNFVVSISKSIVTTVEEFKTWLATNNLYVYFRKSIPEITEITDTTLLEQLEALYELKTYKNVTNVYTTTQNEVPILNVTYLKDLDTIIPTKTSDLTNDSDFISSTVITAFWKGTQAQYDALPSYSNTTLYLIEEE